jgi:hypothetical protein
MLALVLGLSADSARAQSPEPNASPLRYEAPATCPDQGFFVERMRARLSADGVRALTSLSLRVKLEPSGTAVHGSLRIDRGSKSAQRSLDGENCREVVEGLALIAALAVGTPANRNAARGHTASASVSEHASRDRRVSPASTKAESPATQPMAAAAERAARTRDPADAPAPVAHGEEIPANSARAEPLLEPSRAAGSDRRDTDVSDDSPPDRDRGSDPRPRSWAAGAALLALHGFAPSIRPGLQLRAALTLATGPLDWSVRLGGRIALPDTVRSTQGTAHFRFLAGLVQLCAAGALGDSLSLAGCAVAEPGLLTADGEDTRNARSHSRAWFAAGGGAELGWRVASFLALHLGSELLVPTRRDRMLLAGDILHRVPPACLRLELGVEVPLG